MKVSEGWEKGEGGCEADMCSSHVKDVSENVVLYYLITFYHLEAAESVCQCSCCLQDGHSQKNLSLNAQIPGVNCFLSER